MKALRLPGREESHAARVEGEEVVAALIAGFAASWVSAVQEQQHYRYGTSKTDDEYKKRLLADRLREFISYAAGCMFSRYSLANAGETLDDSYAEWLNSLPPTVRASPCPKFLF